MASSSSNSFFDIEPLECGETCRATMDACSLCGKRLAGDRDIFMYRGDTPFCSEECRYRRMVSDGVGARKNKKPFNFNTEHRHEAPAAARPARVRIAADVPVAN
ncbi:hypothetical protein PAHAL_1G352300 [Panicum hallii]|uniref:FLZ-type domain-containing protein n=1 Tax=Panicum hallii TaxID=206008 RepID=A0A2S3GSM9_9POAL|nr:uncharacterized protein LOC112878450 [Panicum hallii]PAN07648.1 hypothetical protein PAHAL_1G352300 [Panicum hallii]